MTAMTGYLVVAGVAIVTVAVLLIDALFLDEYDDEND